MKQLMSPKLKVQHCNGLNGLAWLCSNGNTVPINPICCWQLHFYSVGVLYCLLDLLTNVCSFLLDTGMLNHPDKTGRVSFYVCGCFDGWCEQKRGAMLMQCLCPTRTAPVIHLCELKKHRCKMWLWFYFFQALQVITLAHLKSKVTERLPISSHSSSCGAIATAAFKLHHVTTR